VSSEVFGRKQSWAPGARRICDGWYLSIKVQLCHRTDTSSLDRP
jgi:hypothetical protein